MTAGPDRPWRPALPRPPVLLAAVAATTLGTAVRDLGTGLLGAAAVLVLAGRDDSPAVSPPAWPAPVAEPEGQVGHPLVTELLADLERADRDGTVLRRLVRRVELALARPAPRPVHRVADLQAMLHRPVAGVQDD